MSDIAKRLGIAQSAVSYALSGKAGVGKELRERVQKVADELHYRPNPLAAGLARSKADSKTKPIHAAFAWLNAWPKPELMHQMPQFESYYRGALSAAERFGYRLDEFVVNEEMPLRRVAQILRARNISGILLPPHAAMDVPWHEVNWEWFSVVRFGFSFRNLPPFHVVSADQAGNAYLSFTKMREKGYKRIGFVGVSEKEWKGLAGFAQAQFSIPEKERIPPLLHRFWEGTENLEKPRSWLEKYRPDAILIEHGQFYLQLKALGLEAPRDFGLATTVIPDVPLDSGIHQNPEEIGRVAVLLLLSLLQDNAHGIPGIFRQVLISGTWIDGPSLPSIC
jgi:DNA-binding LacI/PurR family transcriptional regulator